jgi:RimJ/RimL family protein N-acetyltransferase
VARLSLPPLRTDRLRLEPVGAHHLPLLVDLNADPEVMRFILGRAATEQETYDEWRTRLASRTDVARGLGYWAGFTEAGFAGWWGASSFAGDASVAVLGYRLRRAAWGLGLATEGARAVLGQAFAEPGVAAVTASTMAVNSGSRNVLAKAGLRHVRTWVEEWDDPIPGWEQGEVGYVLSRPEWAAARPA